jgi:general secretion pathway protein D
MRSVAATVIVALAVFLGGRALLTAQDDFNLDALLDDISSVPATSAPPAETAEPAPAGDDDMDFEALLGVGDAGETHEESIEPPPAPAFEEAVPPEVTPTPEPAAEDFSDEEPASDESFAPTDEAAAEPIAEPTAEPDFAFDEPAPPTEEPAEDPWMAEPEAAAPAPVEVDAWMTGEEETPAAAPVQPPAIAPAPSDDDDDFLGQFLGGEEEPPPAVVDTPAAEEDLFGMEEEPAPAPAPSGREPPPPVVEAEVLPADKQEAAKLLNAREEVRLQARERDALKALEAGYLALTEKNYSEAQKQFELALQMPVRPKNEEALKRAQWGYAEANYQLADGMYRKKVDTEQALELVNRGLQRAPDHRSLQRLKVRLEELAVRPVPPVPVAKREEVVAKRKTVAELYSEGRQFFEAREYDKAETLFDQILAEDPYHQNAMRYLKRINEIRYQFNTREKEATAADMLQQVRDKWNPATRGSGVALPGPGTVRGPAAPTATQQLQRKLETFEIPLMEFRQANITDVVNFLVDASIASDPERQGVNIVLNLNIPGQDMGMSAPAPAAADPFAGGGFGDDFFGAAPTPAPAFAPAPMAGSSSIPLITLNLRRVKLIDAIRYITEVSNLKYRLEGNAVIITRADVVSGQVITRLYPVQPSILDLIVERGESAPGGGGGGFGEVGAEFGRSTSFQRGDVKDFFSKAGVPFPVGTSITYNPGISKLIVANTPENHDKLDRVLAEINLTPSQVEIEARFVEVSQSDLEELGLEWLLNDDYEIAYKKGPGGVAMAERIQLDANAEQGGFTRGLRFFSFDNVANAIDPTSFATRGNLASPLGNIMSFSSVLTNPELTIILHALSQQGRSDLLSAPRVTTRTGQSATIQVVQEIIYPTEFEQDITVIEGGETPDRQVVTVTPGAFQTRPIGVILNVTPTVGPDGYTIDLALAPEVAELVDWLNYGSIFEGQIINIPQPVFASRNVTTSISIWDGQTVVMGGLIREDLVTVKDKIPILGDIPFLGRLFRNEGQRSTKRNLIIFVTARLVRPDGRPLNTGEVAREPGAPAGGETITP